MLMYLPSFLFNTLHTDVFLQKKKKKSLLTYHFDSQKKNIFKFFNFHICTFDLYSYMYRNTPCLRDNTFKSLDIYMGLMFEPNSVILVSQILYFPPCETPLIRPFEILREFSKIIREEQSPHRYTQVSQKLEFLCPTAF